MNEHECFACLDCVLCVLNCRFIRYEHTRNPLHTHTHTQTHGMVEMQSAKHKTTLENQIVMQSYTIHFLTIFLYSYIIVVIIFFSFSIHSFPFCFFSNLRLLFFVFFFLLHFCCTHSHTRAYFVFVFSFVYETHSLTRSKLYVMYFVYVVQSNNAVNIYK